MARLTGAGVEHGVVEVDSRGLGLRSRISLSVLKA